MKTYDRPLGKLPGWTAAWIAFFFAAAFSMPGHAAAAAAAIAEAESAPFPLAIVAITGGQSARINVVNAANPERTEPPGPITVEMAFHDQDHQPITDRHGRPVEKTVIIDPDRADFLELNGNWVAARGDWVTIVPCVRILSGGEASRVVPSFELYQNRAEFTRVLAAGALARFDSAPESSPLPELSFGALGLTEQASARLYVLLNPPDPVRTNSPPDPVTVEITFHDAEGLPVVDRNGNEARKLVTLDPDQVDFLDLNGADLVAPGERITIIPCIRVVRGAPGVHVSAMLGLHRNDAPQTLLLISPPEPVIPATR